MNNQEKLKDAFAKALGVEPDVVKDTLQYNSIPEWDSVAHLALIAELEETFDIMFDTDDIINLSSPLKARGILEKYGVEF